MAGDLTEDTSIISRFTGEKIERFDIIFASWNSKSRGFVLDIFFTYHLDRLEREKYKPVGESNQVII